MLDKGSAEQSKFSLIFTNETDIDENRLRKEYRFDFIVGHHPKMIEILDIISLVADTEATVLIQGESGTGKELIAQALHYNSCRSKKPFVPINCGALPENLLESELFGHVRGAFTGAIRNRKGWFECAEGGTIFLDEVNEMSPAMQIGLLRILQTGEYSMVGSTTIHRCNARIVAATTKDLNELIEKGEFREELFYRLNVIDIDLPPLRERRCDILLLAEHFLKVYEAKYKRKGLCLLPEAKEILLSYTYQGNVRELENIIEHATIITKGNAIGKYQLPGYVFNDEVESLYTIKNSEFKEAKRKIVENFEKKYITDCLQTSCGIISRAAKKAGIHITNFYAKMKKYGIDSYKFKVLDLES